MDEASAAASVPYSDLLRGVSRTFALSIPELPSPLDEWVESAYLVCRIIDTIEDRPDTDESTRQRMFDELVAALGPPVRFEHCCALAEQFAGQDDNDPCRELMTSCGRVFARVDAFPEEAVAAIRTCALDMTDGLRRTPLPNSADGPQFVCQTLADLEQYCHYAAGVVGIMLTRLFYLCLDRDPSAVDDVTMGGARRFGLGLQLTNIVKDHPSDLVDGRSFIPPEAAERVGLSADALLQPALPLPVRALIVGWAAEQLDCALEYTLAFPPEPPGIRLFCIQPLMMAVMTLDRVLSHLDVTPDDRPKITREQVQEVMARSRELVGDDEQLRAWYRQCRRRLADRLASLSS